MPATGARSWRDYALLLALACCWSSTYPLAKLALDVKARFNFVPVIYSCNPGINRLLKSMGFQRLFELHEDTCDAEAPEQVIPVRPGSAGEVKAKVIEAHRVLMGLSEENRARFEDLMAVLERG